MKLPSLTIDSCPNGDYRLNYTIKIYLNNKKSKKQYTLQTIHIYLKTFWCPLFSIKKKHQEKNLKKAFYKKMVKNIIQQNFE
jgi:hypothetical protein